MFKGLVSPALVTLLALAVIPASATAAGGGGGFTPGVYHFSDDLADTELFAPDGAAVIDVSQGDFLANPRTGSVVTLHNQTVLAISLGTSTFFGYGCYLIPSGDFRLSPDLHAATLHTTLPAGPPSLSGPAAQLALPRGRSVSPFAGGGGGGGVGCGGGTGFPTSLTIDVTWTWKGFVASTSDNSQFKCLDTSITSHGQFDRAPSTVQAHFSGVTDTFGLNFSSVAHDTVDQNLLGAGPSIECFFP